MSTKRSRKKPSTPSRAKPARRTHEPSASHPQAVLLDDQTSACVIGEYVAIGSVKPREIDAILGPQPQGCSAREIAVILRMAEVLSLPDAFVLAPRFAGPFACLRAVVRADAAPQDVKL